MSAPYQHALCTHLAPDWGLGQAEVHVTKTWYRRCSEDNGQSHVPGHSYSNGATKNATGTPLWRGLGGRGGGGRTHRTAAQGRGRGCRGISTGICSSTPPSRFYRALLCARPPAGAGHSVEGTDPPTACGAHRGGWPGLSAAAQPAGPGAAPGCGRGKEPALSRDQAKPTLRVRYPHHSINHFSDWMRSVTYKGAHSDNEKNGLNSDDI